MPLRIAVYAITKNEASFVERFLASCREADLVVIADTGSTDGTQELARQHGATVYDICITPWRFDKARDAALALVPKDIDICISLDLDEMLVPGWREKMEAAWVPGTTRLRYWFDWSNGIVFQSEKTHARHGYHWHHPCHEYPRPDARIQEQWAVIDELLVIHKPDPTKSRGHYLDLLELSVKEDPHCPRNAFYYARELTFVERWADAVDALHRYLSLPAAIWSVERAFAMRLLGKSYGKLGKADLAAHWFQRATQEAPTQREPWVDWAFYAYGQADWATCWKMATTALELTHRERLYTSDPAAWGALPHDLAGIAAFHLGRLEDAVGHGAMALTFAPDDARLRRNLDEFVLARDRANGVG